MRSGRHGLRASSRAAARAEASVLPVGTGWPPGPATVTCITVAVGVETKAAAAAPIPAKDRANASTSSAATTRPIMRTRAGALTRASVTASGDAPPVAASGLVTVCTPRGRVCSSTSESAGTFPAGPSPDRYEATTFSVPLGSRAPWRPSPNTTVVNPSASWWVSYT